MPGASAGRLKGRATSLFGPHEFALISVAVARDDRGKVHCAVPVVTMSEFQRAARGGSVSVGSATIDVPPHILGMTTSVRAAIKRVHDTSPAAGSSYIRNSLNHYLARAGSSNPGHRASATAAEHYIDAVDLCGQWHAVSGLALKQWQLRGYVPFSNADGVDAVVRAVLEDPVSGAITGRVLLWDSLAITPAAAELVAAPAVALMDQHYSPTSVAQVEVWQCFHHQPQQLTVTAPTARAATASAASFVASM